MVMTSLVFTFPFGITSNVAVMPGDGHHLKPSAVGVLTHSVPPAVYSAVAVTRPGLQLQTLRLRKGLAAHACHHHTAGGHPRWASVGQDTGAHGLSACRPLLSHWEHRLLPEPEPP